MIRILAFVCVITFFSCSSSKKVDGGKDVSTNNAPKELSSEVLTQGNNSGFMEQSNQIVGGLDELGLTWGQAFKNYTRIKPIPIIDFEKQMVVLVTMGERTNGGYSIRIDTIKEDANTITVNIIEEQPGTSCNSPSVIVHPYQIVAFEKSTKKVVFKTVEKVKECEK